MMYHSSERRRSLDESSSASRLWTLAIVVEDIFRLGKNREFFYFIYRSHALRGNAYAKSPSTSLCRKCTVGSAR